VTGEEGAAEDIDHETFAWKCLALAGERRLCFFRRASGNAIRYALFSDFAAREIDSMESYGYAPAK